MTDARRSAAHLPALSAPAFSSAETPVPTVAPPAAQPLDAYASDPVGLGLMRGAPPAADSQVRLDDGSLYTFPKLRWAYSNMRRLFPTAQVWRGEGWASVLPRTDRADLDAVRFLPIGGTQPITWAESLAANYTDGIVVLHKGRIVLERYYGALAPHRPHIAWSVTKSFFGTIAAALIAEGRLDADASVPVYVPELATSGFATATVRQVLDMTTAIKYSEDYTDPQAEVFKHGRAGGITTRAVPHVGAASLYDFLVTLQTLPGAEHGRAFAYKTVNTDVLGWIIRRVTGQPLGEVLQERIWSQLGCEQDGYLMTDTTGTEFAGGGFNAALRDLARFGEMMRNDGFYNEAQIVPKAVIDDIRTGGDPAHFAQASYATLPGWSYRNMWWVSHNEHGAYCARGIHGQGVYIDPKAEMVIARFASHPMAGNANLDPMTLPAYHALAKHLLAS